MNYMDDWSQDPILRGDPLISGLKHETPLEVMKATDFVEKWLEATKEEVSIDGLKKELTDFETKNESIIKIEQEVIIDCWYICYHCQLIKESLGKLRKHIKTKHLFPRKRRSIREINIKINIPRSKVCPHCDYCSNFPGNVTRHLKEVHGLGIVLLQKCELCPFSSKRKSELKLHIKSKHTFEYHFFCSHCDYKSLRKKHLQKHMFKRHSLKWDLPKNRRPMVKKEEQCEFCDYRSSDPYCLKSHIMYRHTKEKPFICSLCNHRTTRACDLNSHFRSVHSKERPFFCPNCSYRAKRSTHLKSHIHNRHTFKKKQTKNLCE